MSWWGEHKINHRPRWLPRGQLQHSLSCGNKNTAISGICGWWLLTNTAASCPVSLNFNFLLLQSMSAAVCLFLHHSLNPLLAICPLALVAFLSTILICLGSHFSTCTTVYCITKCDCKYRAEQSCSGKEVDKRATSAASRDMSQNQRVSQTPQSLHTAHTAQSLTICCWQTDQYDMPSVHMADHYYYSGIL